MDASPQARLQIGQLRLLNASSGVSRRGAAERVYDQKKSAMTAFASWGLVKHIIRYADIGRALSPGIR
jgi:hypothetical protein